MGIWPPGPGEAHGGDRESPLLRGLLDVFTEETLRSPSEAAFFLAGWRRRGAGVSESWVSPVYHPLSVSPELVVLGTAVTGVSGAGPGYL